MAECADICEEESVVDVPAGQPVARLQQCRGDVLGGERATKSPGPLAQALTLAPRHLWTAEGLATGTTRQGYPSNPGPIFGNAAVGWTGRRSSSGPYAFRRPANLDFQSDRHKTVRELLVKTYQTDKIAYCCLRVDLRIGIFLNISVSVGH